jgi:hypothetical protein
MRRKRNKEETCAQEKSRRTPTFLLELPLVLDAGQAKRVRAHLEVGRLFYNAVLSQGWRRLKRMRENPAWQVARALPRTQKPERAAAFSALRAQYGFSEGALHAYAKEARVSFLQEEGQQGYLLWKNDRLAASIDWNDPVVKYGLDHRIKYARLIRRKASSPQAKGADTEGFRYFVQLALEGVPYHKPKHPVGSEIIGADLGPCTIALFPQNAEASLSAFCEELAPDEKELRRLQRKMDRQRRAANPNNYDQKGRVNKRSQKKLHWKSSRGYERIHQCACGIGPVQRDLYSAFLAAYLDPRQPDLSHAQYHRYWESAEARLRAAWEDAYQRAKEGQVLPRSFGIPRARLPRSLNEAPQEPAFLFTRGRLEAWEHRSEPSLL